MMFFMNGNREAAGRDDSTTAVCWLSSRALAAHWSGWGAVSFSAADV